MFITNEQTNLLIAKTREFFEFTKSEDFVPMMRFSQEISGVDAPKVIDILCSEDYHGFSADKWHIGSFGSVWMDIVIGRKVIRAYFEETTRGKFVTTCNVYRAAESGDNQTKIPTRIPEGCQTGKMTEAKRVALMFDNQSTRILREQRQRAAARENTARMNREQQRADKKLKKMEMESKRKEDAKNKDAYVDSNLKPAKLPDNYSNKSGDETSGDETSGDEMKPRKIKRRDMVPDEPVVVKESKNSAKKASKKAAKASRKK